MLKTNTYKINNAYIVTQEYGTNIGWVATFPGFVANGDTESNALAALARQVVKVSNTIESYAKIGRDPVPANVPEVTADNLTDEMICVLRAKAHGSHFINQSDSLIELCDIARSAIPTGRDPDGTIITREIARARCAKIINANADEKR